MIGTRQAREATDRNDVARAQRGDLGAFRELYDHHATSSWRLALVVGRDRAVAEGAVVDAFAQVLGGSVRRDALRFATVGTQLLHAARESAISRSNQVGAVISPDRPDGLDSDTDEDAVAAFDALPERWRSALWLQIVEDLSLATTATVLGLTAASATELSQRALAGLREQFALIESGRALHPACQLVTRELGGYADQTLAADEAATVRSHLDRCAVCRGRLERIDDLAMRLRPRVPALPVALLPLAEEAWRERTRADGPLGMRLPGGAAIPAWAERSLVGATAAVVGLGITAAVALGGRSSGRDPEGTPQVAAGAGTFSSAGDNALGGSNLPDDTTDGGAASAPTATLAPSATQSGGGATAGSSGAVARSADPGTSPTPSAPSAPSGSPAPAPSQPSPTPDPPPTTEPTTPSEPAPDSGPLDPVTDLLDPLDVCTGVTLLDPVTGCEATEATSTSTGLGL